MYSVPDAGSGPGHGTEEEPMKLERLTRRVWIYPYEEERDRPNLGYVRGDRWSLAVDAGHSRAHVEEFYRALEAEGLPLPALTVLTHWHWDHTFGMHVAHGLTASNARTNAYLADFRGRIEAEGLQVFLSLDESIRREYAGGLPVVVTLPDLVFSGELRLDAGGCPIRAFQADAPHTDDSTLVHLPGEGVLFLGDSAGGTFPTWEKDRALADRLAATVADTGAEICVEGHWIPVTTRDMLEDLAGDEG